MSDGFLEKCRQILCETWKTVSQGVFKSALSDNGLREAIQRSINSPTKSYRYVLPTQLVAKLADGSLDSRCVQASRGGTGAFDARSLSQKIVVRFDKENERVLGGSAEPYVNNPLRVPEITRKYRTQQKDKNGWDDLCYVLDEVEKEQSPQFTKTVFDEVMSTVFNRLAETRISYPIPRRISYAQTRKLLEEYMAAPSGGDRPLAIAYAFLETVGKSLELFTEVRRAKITAADVPSGQVADIECYNSTDLILAVEVKDRELTINHVSDKLASARSRNVSELLFLIQKGIRKENGKEISELVTKEFASGQNIYILSLAEFISNVLVLLGENWRREFVSRVGNTLDKYGSAVSHRRAWAELLFNL